MESYLQQYSQVVQQEKAQALHLLANSGAWRYSLHGLQNDGSSLANLLGINDAIPPMIYDCCGWSHAMLKESAINRECFKTELYQRQPNKESDVGNTLRAVTTLAIEDNQINERIQRLKAMDESER